MKQEARIRAAYFECMRLHERYQIGFGNLLEQAVDAATVEERRHRRLGGGRWKVSVAVTARWFAVRWFLDVKAYALPQDWAEVCALRDDCRLAYGAISQVLRGIGPDRAATEVDELRERYADVLAYDYTEWVSR